MSNRDGLSARAARAAAREERLRRQSTTPSAEPQHTVQTSPTARHASPVPREESVLTSLASTIGDDSTWSEQNNQSVGSTPSE